MVKRKLVEALLSDGAKLLRELDRHQVPVRSMMWVLLPEQEYWRLIIVSPLVVDGSTREAYQAIDEVWRAQTFAGLEMFDISVVSPDSRDFARYRSIVTHSSRLAKAAEWVEYEDAVVYRLSSN